MEKERRLFLWSVSDFTQILELYGNIILTSGFREVEVWQIESCIDKTMTEPLVSYRMVLSDPFESNGQKDQMHIAHFVNYAGYDSDVLDDALEEFFSDERFQAFDVDVF
ncbi:hypothetical protein KC909_06225 [Candidatus Dojkabacteria bacterium]|uniref:Uncharacterized protein n=1 Tax=Candidatus Dojkabacteria bacterium TaxID=2099670 RepID=A0A955L6I2_9BACT|nr:hypothetical protein [Candidatus Dojkabacteria bacterium]